MQRSRAHVLVILMAGAVIVALVATTLGVLLNADRSAGAAPAERLPDLDQETPSDVAVRVDVARGKQSFQLGFRSAVVNVGAGPLVLTGSRPNTTTPDMVVNQLIEGSGAGLHVVSAVGRMRYTVSKGHQHWHYLGFDRYELRRADPGAAAPPPLLRDEKTGFCLGDRYQTTEHVRGHAPKTPVFKDRCGLNRPDLLRMREGISVGFGDDYKGFLEGQQLPLDGLPNGRYVLVHRVNSDRHLEELSYTNNAASVLLDLHWQHGIPSVRVVTTCPDTDRCDVAFAAAHL